MFVATKQLKGTLSLNNGGTSSNTAVGARTALGLSTVAASGAYSDLSGLPTAQTTKTYVIGVTQPGTTAASGRLIVHALPYIVTLPTGLSTSAATALTAATASTPFILAYIRSNVTTAIATFTFAAAATTATISGVVIPALLTGDIIILTGPATPDATLADIGFSIVANVSSAVFLNSGSVTQFNTRTGAITLTSADITGAGGALLANTTFTGTTTVAALSSSASTTIINSPNGALLSLNAAVASVNYVAFSSQPTAGAPSIYAQGSDTNIALYIAAKGSQVVYVGSRITAAAGLDVTGTSSFSSSPVIPTPAAGDNSTNAASTAFVNSRSIANAIIFG